MLFRLSKHPFAKNSQLNYFERKLFTLSKALLCPNIKGKSNLVEKWKRLKVPFPESDVDLFER